MMEFYLLFVTACLSGAVVVLWGGMVSNEKEVRQLRKYIEELEDEIFGPDDDPDDGEPIPEETNVVELRKAA